MTSLSTIGPEQKHLEGRTVRDIVEYSPDHVNEVWCRKIFRQILQSLELQYAMHMPHRAITPDTVVFHDNGEPLLVPSDVALPRLSGDATPEQMLRADLTALAGVVHYAITRELSPAGPLRGRGLEGYSGSLVTAVDRCMATDPAEHPHTIEALRNILGIVALGPPVAARPRAVGPDTLAASAAPMASAASAAAAPGAGGADSLSFLQEAPRRRFGTGLGLWQRRALAAGGGAILLAIAMVIFAEMRDSNSYNDIALKLPQQPEHAGPTQAAQASAPAVPAPALPGADAGAGAGAAADTGALAGAGAAASAEVAMPAAASSPAASDPIAAFAGGSAGTNTQPPHGQPDQGAGTAPVPPYPAVAAQGQPAAPLRARGGRVQAAPAANRSASGATIRLNILPWGTVYVDGVDRGVSPPMKRLVLTPGPHTIRIVNSNFRERVFEVDAGRGDGRIAIDFNSEAP